jgi:hypothetical protein
MVQLKVFSVKPQHHQEQKKINLSHRNMKKAIVRKLVLTLVETSKVWVFLPDGFQRHTW